MSKRRRIIKIVGIWDLIEQREPRPPNPPPYIHTQTPGVSCFGSSGGEGEVFEVVKHDNSKKYVYKPFVYVCGLRCLEIFDVKRIVFIQKTYVSKQI